MSAKRSLVRRNLKQAGWKGRKSKRGKPLEDAAHDVAIVLGVLKARDRAKSTLAAANYIPKET